MKLNTKLMAATVLSVSMLAFSNSASADFFDDLFDGVDPSVKTTIAGTTTLDTAAAEIAAANTANQAQNGELLIAALQNINKLQADAGISGN